MKFLLFFIISLISSCNFFYEKEKNLKLSFNTEILDIDPAKAYDVVANTVIYQIYETLYEYHYLKRPYTLQPNLAVGMPKISEDGLKYTIKIKKGVLYHKSPFLAKGREVKAVDFITQIKRIAFKGTKSPGWWLLDGKIVGLNEFRNKAGTDYLNIEKLQVSGLQVLDDYSFTIELTRPFPQLIYALSMTFTAPLPQEVVSYYKNVITDVAFGTGPFYLEKFSKNQETILRKNERYRNVQYPAVGDRWTHRKGFLGDAHKQIPFLDSITFKVIPDDELRWQAFLDEEVDFIEVPRDKLDQTIRNGQLSLELAKKGIKLDFTPSLTFWWLAFNMKDPIWGANLKLRQAINLAINMEEFVAKFTSNIGLNANSIFPPGVPGYNPSILSPYKYDLEEAKKQLELAGYPDGEGLPVLEFDLRDENVIRARMGQFIQESLAKIGIKVKINNNKFSDYQKKARRGTMQFWQDGWAMDYPDAENILQLLYSKNSSVGTNKTQYYNPQFDELYEKIASVGNSEQKFVYMEQAQEIIFKDLPWIMQFYAQNYILYHQRVKNLRYSEMVFNYLKYINITH